LVTVSKQLLRLPFAHHCNFVWELGHGVLTGKSRMW